MKTVFLNLATVYGGQEIFLKRLIGHLHQNTDMDVEFVGGPSMLIDELDVPCLAIPNPSYSKFLSIKNQLHKRYGNIPCQLIFNGYRAYYLGSLMNADRKVGVLHPPLSAPQMGWKKQGMRQLLVPPMSMGYDAVVGVSQYSLSGGWLPWLSGDRQVIYNSVDSQHFSREVVSADDEEGWIQGDDFVITIVGRLEESKGQDIAIDAFEKLHQKHPQSKLLIVGDGGTRSWIEQRIRESSCSKNIRLKGFLQDVRPVLARANLMWILSRSEGLPLTLLESMGCDCPVMSTPVGGIPEVIEHGKNGWLAPREAAAFAEQTHQLLEAPSRLKEVADTGRETILRRFDNQVIFQQWEKLLGSIAK